MFSGERGPGQTITADPVGVTPSAVPDAVATASQVPDAVATAPQVPDAVAPPPGNPRFPALDGLRGMAELCIVTSHAGEFVNNASTTPVGILIAHWDVAVTIFFTMTGFLLYRPMFAAAVGDVAATPKRVFYRRRVLRIVPGYWVALLLLAPILTFASPLGLPNFSFLQIYRGSWWHSGIQPAWTVCVEMTYYLVIPWYAHLLNRAWRHLDRETRRRRELVALACIVAGSLVLRELVRHFLWNPHAVDPLPTTIPWFCCGMALAIISVDAGRYTSRFRDFAAQHPWVCWSAALAIFAATLTGTADWQRNVFVFVGFGLMSTLIMAPLVFGSAGWFFRHRVVRWIGLVSYGIYLYHYPIESEVAKIHFGVGPTMNVILIAVMGIGLAVLAATASYYLL